MAKQISKNNKARFGIPCSNEWVFSMCGNLFSAVVDKPYSFIRPVSFVWRKDTFAQRKNSSRRTAEHASSVENYVFQFVGYPTKEQETQLSHESRL